MAESKFIIGLLLYIFTISTLIAYFAVGMGYTGIVDPSTLIKYEQPAEVEEGDRIWFISDVADFLSDVGQGAAFAGAYLSTISAVIVWTLPETLFPLWANIIFIKIPLIGLVVSVIEVFIP